MEPETKTLQLELNADGDGPEGSFRATFATFDVIDHHGDVTRPGAFESGKGTLVGAYMHDLWSLPVGKGEIGQDGERAWVDGQFNLKTTSGRDTYEMARASGDLLEWSYVFVPTQTSEGEWDAGDGVQRPVRFLEKIDVWSVDPVLRGAGINTRTDFVKARTPNAFNEHADELVTAVRAFVQRTEARLDMRAKDGRSLSADDRDRVTVLLSELKGLEDLESRLEDALRSKADDQIDLHREYLRFQRATALDAGLIAVP